MLFSEEKIKDFDPKMTEIHVENVIFLTKTMRFSTKIGQFRREIQCCYIV